MSVSLDRSSSALYGALSSDFGAGTGDAQPLVVEFERVPLVSALSNALAPSMFTLVNLPIHSPFTPPFELPYERPDPLPAGPTDPGSSDDNGAPMMQRPERPDAAQRLERSELAERSVRPEPALRPDRPELLQRPDRGDLPRAETVAPTVEQAVAKLMQRFDADDNGSVTLAEFGNGFAIGGRRLELGPLLKRAFDHLDSNDNGTLAASEFHAVLARLDRDGDGRLERGEAAAIVLADMVALVGVLLHAETPGLGG